MICPFKDLSPPARQLERKRRRLASKRGMKLRRKGEASSSGDAGREQSGLDHQPLGGAHGRAARQVVEPRQREFHRLED